MSKWKCGICNSEFDNFQAQGFGETIYCPLCYFKELYRRTKLEIDRLNNIINELEKYIIDEIDDAQEELNIILQGDNLDYKNECTKEFNCIKNALDMLLNKLKALKEE